MDPALTVYKMFREFDILREGKVAADDISNYEKQFYIRISEQESAWVIREYDADEDGYLSLDEFSNLILPSTNPRLR